MIDESSAPAAPARGRSFLRKYGGLICAITLIVLCGAAGASALLPREYTSHARLLVESLTVPTAVDRTPDMGTEQAIAGSDAVLRGAAHTLHTTVRSTRDAVTVTVSVTATVLDIGYTASSAAAAQHGATAVANAYTAYRGPAGGSAVPTTGNHLTPPHVQARLISPAALPTSPSSPDLVIILIAGLLVGLLAGTAAAFALDRFGRRVRSIARWAELTGVPVLAGLPREPARTGSGAPALAPASEAALRYVQVRAGRAVPRHGGVLLVTAASAECRAAGTAHVLTNLFLDAGTSAVLVEVRNNPAGRPPGTPATAPLGELQARSRVRSTGQPGLQTATAWTAVSAQGLIKRIERHRATHDLVLVVTPPLAASLSCLDVAAVADAALVLDDVGSARRPTTLRLVTELRGAGCLVVGAVLTGLPEARLGEPGPPAAVRPAPLVLAEPVPAPAPVRSPLAAWAEFEDLGQRRIIHSAKTNGNES